MRPISYARATDVASAIVTVSADPERAYLAGGTTEIDLLRQGVVSPSGLVDINALPLKQIEDLADGGLRIGALARMSEVAEVPGVVERFPVIAQALVLGASPQLRHMASMGGNLLQRGRQSARRQRLRRDWASRCCCCHRQRRVSRHWPPRPRIADQNGAPLINKSSTGILAMPVLNGGANQVTRFGILSSDASEVRYPDALKGERDVSFLRRESTAAS